jgi:hypothetical protein
MEKLTGFWSPFENGDRIQAKVDKILSNNALGDQLEYLVKKYSIAAR